MLPLSVMPPRSRYQAEATIRVAENYAFGEAPPARSVPPG